MLDTARRVATPEGIELSLRLAGPVPRALAWAVDVATRIVAVWVLALVLGPAGLFGTGALFLALFFFEWLFPAWCEARWNGMTPGKRVLGLMVLNDDGSPVRWPAALTRNLLRTVDFLPLLYAVGLTAMLVNRDFKRLGDLAAGTVVVYRDGAYRSVQIPPAPPLAPPATLTLGEQRTLLDLAERAPLLSPQRVEELAELAAPLVGETSGDPAERVARVANYLVGRR
jgi:uncharacterized RDD family membrane protein YckC